MVMSEIQSQKVHVSCREGTKRDVIYLIYLDAYGAD
jgi:hypothetical protein